jgi:hypothetical protein
MKEEPMMEKKKMTQSISQNTARGVPQRFPNK